MTAPAWKQIPALDDDTFRTARLTLHWAVQVPAALAYQCIPPEPDYGHTSMSWAPEHGALLTDITGGRSPVRAGLRFRDLGALLVDGRGKVVAERTLVGMTLDEAYAWLDEVFSKYTGTSSPGFRRPDLILPPHPLGGGARFESLTDAAKEVVATWFHNADTMLRFPAADLEGSPSVRIWPHHFDAAALYVFDEDGDPEHARSLGLGFTPGDESEAKPYWYVLPWPRPEPQTLPPITVGRWQTEAFIGGQLVDGRNEDEVRAFFRETSGALKNVLARTGARKRLTWYRAAGIDELPEGRVKATTCGRQTICLTHHEGRFGALDNRCPHQGGPLGEGTIENGVLRCPWHGWDYDPITGRSVGPYDDGVETFPTEVREDGIYVGLEEAPPHQTTVSDIMVRTMTEWGVEAVFGMVGHSNLGLSDALRLEAEAGRLRYFGIRHEGAAAFAASAYGKLTGEPAACLGIAGPGATNLLTGLWDANVDRAPVLALTGQVDTQVLGPGAFQEVDLRSAYGGVAQWAQTVLTTSKHSELMNLALKTARLHRGVSHLIFPDEVQTRAASDQARAGSPEGRLPNLGVRPPQETLDAAVARIAEAKRPAIIVGHGARFDMPGIIELAERLGAPILTTFKGKGLVPDHHPLGCGVLGRSGTPIASWFMNEADLLVVFGASFSNHTGITGYKPTIQIDFEPNQLARFHPITIPVYGEIRATSALLAEALDGNSSCEDHRPEVAERWRLWRLEKESRVQDDLGRGISSAAVFASLTRQVPSDAIMPVDVGNNTYAFGRYFEASEQAVLMSGYLGSIGFALPAAMGAWAATTGRHERFRGRKVVSVSGDGGLGQYLAEITTLVKYEMDITHIVLNNNELGKISKEQRAGDWPVWQTALVNPDFAAFARNCGAHGVRLTDPKELDAAVAEAIKVDGPALVEIVTDTELV